MNIHSLTAAATPCPTANGSGYPLPDRQRLISSNYYSRYNTQTRRLTPEMFAAVFEKIQAKD
jgi:hypothetical protein